MLALLLFRAGVEDRRGADGECRCVEDDRQLIAAGLVVERSLVCDGQAQPAILAREADPGESAFIQLLLKFAGAQPRRLFTTVGFRRVVRVDARHVVREPCSGTRGELFD